MITQNFQAAPDGAGAQAGGLATERPDVRGRYNPFLEDVVALMRKVAEGRYELARQ